MVGGGGTATESIFLSKEVTDASLSITSSSFLILRPQITLKRAPWKVTKCATPSVPLDIVVTRMWNAALVKQ